MSDIESPSVARDAMGEVLPRHPHREIAELLALAIRRMHAGGHAPSLRDPREVCLAFDSPPAREYEPV